jgi:23S rRNA (cytosine1962-C5)-methyltransferase
LSDLNWEKTLVLQRNDVSIRKLEGLQSEQAVVLKSVDGEDLTNVEILIQNAMDAEKTISFSVNLIEGQKTGFFLDQSFNIKLLLEQLSHQKKNFAGKKLKILDLCCYMGQWSSQIVANLKEWGVQAEVHLVDVSDFALQKAQQNIQKYAEADYPIEVLTYKKDVLSLEEFAEAQFDVIISDPPAFVKNKKDIHQGLHAYFKLNAQAFKMAAPGALIVSCTCSGAVQFEDFKETLRKSILRSGKVARCVSFGGQGWDHPTLMSFPEGFYLKMVMHQLE